jgi:hypothetical protein
MNKLIIYLTFFVSLSLWCFKGYTQDKDDVERFKAEMMPVDEMIKTADKAVQLIQNKNYTEFKKLFVEDIAKSISDQQIVQLVDGVNLLFQKEGVPSGKENILHNINATVIKGDTIFINQIMYNFQPVSNGGKSYTRVLIFSFLKQYGTEKLVGVNLSVNPLSTGDAKPTIQQIENFVFDVSEITNFRIYYDEGRYRKTKYKNEIGYFAVEGDASTLVKAGIMPIIKSIFSELSKSKYEKVEPFNDDLNRGENAKFIQAEFGLKDKPYALFIYLPLDDDRNFSNKILLMQREYVNLGYQFTLNQDDYPIIKSEFPKIAGLKLDEYYEDRP